MLFIKLSKLCVVVMRVSGPGPSTPSNQGLTPIQQAQELADEINTDLQEIHDNLQSNPSAIPALQKTLGDLTNQLVRLANQPGLPQGIKDTIRNSSSTCLKIANEPSSFLDLASVDVAR
jgi:hypothetical protein